MDLSEHTINDLQQARITPIPPSTPDRKSTTNHIPEPMNHEIDDTQTYMIHPGNLRKTSILTTTNDTDHNSITSTDSTKNYPALLTTTIDTQLSNPPKQHTFDDNHDHKNLLDNNHGYQKLGKTPAAQVKANCDQDGRQQTPNASVPSTTFRTNNTMTNDHLSTLSQTSSSTRDFIPVNDGTLRITVKWKPDNYASLKNDEDNWNAQAVEMLNDILHLPTMPIQLVPWSTTVQDNLQLLPVSQINASNLCQYRSPKITNIDSFKTSIFGIRISAMDKAFSIGTWLNSPTIKSAISGHNIDLKVSNSTCDSGNMVTAGSILLKHPQYTHRTYFMMSIRRQIPTNSPYFDIVVHRRTLNGIDSPHLVVKCGANHQAILSEILSTLMDGIKTTALYVGTQYIQSLTQEALEDLYDLHQKYVNSIQRLPLSPYVINVDRIRDEHSPKGNNRRTTREWANSLTNSEGQPIQCDAENGGRDKKAYLLVPEHLIDSVRHDLTQYLHNIRNWHVQPNQDNHIKYHDADRPLEIYVPTAAVQRNIEFLKTMASADIWKNAPTTIRQHQSTKITNRPQHGPTQNLVQPSATTPLQYPTQTQQPRTPQSDNLSANRNSRNNFPPIGRHLDDNTITTAYSNTTTLNSGYAAKFADIENAIKTSQSEFKQITTRFDLMENQILNTMTSCHENSKHILAMQGQMNSMQSNVQDIANQMKLLTTHLTLSPTCANEDISTGNHKIKEIKSPEKKKPRQMDPEANLIVPFRENTLANNILPIQLHSPPYYAHQADQPEDQYQDTHFPGSAMEE
jgi:hypothetical protein